MSARDDAIEAGAQALHGDECPDDAHDLCDVGAWDRAAAAVVDAVISVLRPCGCSDSPAFSQSVGLYGSQPAGAVAEDGESDG